MELHPVLMAAGFSSRMHDLTYSCTKPLLPVGNIPLVCYSVALLDKLGFEEAIVIMNQEHSSSIQTAIADHCSATLRLDFIEVSESDLSGTAESLRLAKDKIKSDVLVISCDLICSAPLHDLIDLYRTYDASLTLLLSSTSEHFTEVQAPGPKVKSRIERDIIGLDEENNRLTFFSSLSDLDDELVVKRSLLVRHPHIKMRSDLLDCHVYIMKRWILSYLVDNKSLTSIKEELIPLLIRKQFSKSDIRSYIEEDDLETSARQMSSYDDHNVRTIGKISDDKIKCYAYVLSDKSHFTARVNSIGAYCEVNKQILKHIPSLIPGSDPAAGTQAASKKGKTQIGNDCLLGAGVTVGEKSSMKRSVVGPHVIIGDQVKIANSVIMGHVTIRDGCTISGSVIASHSHIEEKNDIKDSIIGSNKSTPTLYKMTNEVFTDAVKMMEI